MIGIYEHNFTICLFHLQIRIPNFAKRNNLEFHQKSLHYARNFKMKSNIQTQTELQKLKLNCEKSNLLSIYFLS